MTAVHVGGAQFGAVTLLPFAETDDLRTASVVSTMLTAADSDFTWSEFGPWPSITIETTTECGDLGACYDPGSKHVLLGHDLDGTACNQYKNITAHEYGHNIMDILSGLPNADYVEGNNQPDVTTPYCRCDHIDSTNRVHCQVYGACSYTYYKDFLETDNSVTKQPLAKSCLHEKWIDSECVESGNDGHANEWDWADFFRDVNTVPPDGQGYHRDSSTPTLLLIYKNACGATACTSNSFLSFSAFSAGAIQTYGALDVRANYFIGQGDVFGVNH